MTIIMASSSSSKSSSSLSTFIVSSSRTTTTNNNNTTNNKKKLRLRHTHCLYWLLLLLCVYLFGIQRGLQQQVQYNNNNGNGDGTDGSSSSRYIDLWASFLNVFDEDDEEGGSGGGDEDGDGELDNKEKDEEDTVDPSLNLDLTKPRFVAPTTLKLPKPIINVGFPKAGTSTIFNFFHCNGLKSQHWYCCEDQDNPGGTIVNKLMSRCILDNIISIGKNRGNTTTNITNIFQDCGNFDVYTEINGPRGFKDFGFQILLDDGTFAGKRPRLILPQHHYLDEIHEAFPNATFLLNQRPVQDWVKSVMNWPTQLKMELPFEFYAQQQANPDKFSLPTTLLEDEDDEYSNGYNVTKPRPLPQVLTYLYKFHNEYVRNFVKEHPSHTLIEVDITHNETGKILADAFGLNDTCWGHANKNNGGGGKDKKGGKQPVPAPRRAGSGGGGGGPNMRGRSSVAADFLERKRAKFGRGRFGGFMNNQGGRGGGRPPSGVQDPTIDFYKLAEAVAKNTKRINLTIDDYYNNHVVDIDGSSTTDNKEKNGGGGGFGGGGWMAGLFSRGRQQKQLHADLLRDQLKARRQQQNSGKMMQFHQNNNNNNNNNDPEFGYKRRAGAAMKTSAENRIHTMKRGGPKQ